MLRLRGYRDLNISFRAKNQSAIRRYNSTLQSKQHDPLKILFCGADEFSIYSLRALQRLQETNSGKIASIDVVCRPDKRVGRGLKQVHEVPIKSVASNLGLSLHQIDTFKDWSPPEHVNIIIAVSFGLLIPARILTGAKYGGLNVHPSLLPDLRGPAPIIHALLKQRPYTGVTLQTMHPTRFDYGKLLAQTPPLGIPVPPECTPDKLVNVLGEIGSKVLCAAIEDGIFVPPLTDMRYFDLEKGVLSRQSKPESNLSNMEQLEHAPKITPEDRRIDWSRWTAEEIMLRDRILGRLWDNEIYSYCHPGLTSKRTTFHGPWSAQNGEDIPTTAGQPFVIHSGESIHDKDLAIATMDGKVAVPASATIEGESKGTGFVSLIHGLRRRFIR